MAFRFSFRRIRPTLTSCAVALVLFGIIGVADRPVFGFFSVNWPHNILHIFSGALLFVDSLRSRVELRRLESLAAVWFALMATLGLVVPGDWIIGIFYTSTSTDVLNLFLAGVFWYAARRRS